MIDDVSISSTQSAREIALKGMQQPLHCDGYVVKDSSQFAYQQM